MAGGLLGALLIIFIQAAGVPFPIPGGLLLVQAGRQYHWALPISIAIILLSSAVGFLGALVLFALARSGGAPFLAKHGEHMRASPARLESTRIWLDSHGRYAIFLGRLLPGMRTVTGILAGVVRVSWLRYSISAAFAALAWSALYYCVGAMLAAHLALLIGQITGIADVVPQCVLALALVVLIGYAGQRGIRRIAFYRSRGQEAGTDERITPRRTRVKGLRPPAHPGGGSPTSP